MIEGDRPEFEKLLAELFAALDKPLNEAKREGFWKALAKMSVVEFGRCRDLLLRELEDGEARKTCSVADIWAAKRRLRAHRPAFQLEPTSTPSARDPWGEAANRYLLGYLMKRILKHGRKLPGKPASYELMRAPDEAHVRKLGLDMHHLDASAAFIDAVHVLVTAKNAWAADMRDLQVRGEVPAEQQRSIWADYMAHAEAQIAGEERAA